MMIRRLFLYAGAILFLTSAAHAKNLDTLVGFANLGDQVTANGQILPNVTITSGGHGQGEISVIEGAVPPYGYPYGTWGEIEFIPQYFHGAGSKSPICVFAFNSQETQSTDGYGVVHYYLTNPGEIESTTFQGDDGAQHVKLQFPFVNIAELPIEIDFICPRE